VNFFLIKTLNENPNLNLFNPFKAEYYGTRQVLKHTLAANT
jgi:hypothetical protein